MKKKHWLKVVLVCLVLVMIPINTSFATNKTPDQAIVWVQSKLGQAIDYDGAYGAQCVDLV